MTRSRIGFKSGKYGTSRHQVYEKSSGRREVIRKKNGFRPLL
jgi:hypothetical protein